MKLIECKNINIGDLRLDEKELSCRLKSPTPLDSDMVTECLNRVMGVCRPRYCYAKTSVLHKCDGEIVTDFGIVQSVSLARALGGCSEAYVFALTLGIETDRLINALSVTSSARAFAADAVSSALAEAAAEYVNGLLRDRDMLKQRFSPGFGDFVLSYQRDVLSYLGADKFLGIKLGDNLMMTPRKSVTAICGICNE